MSPDTDCYHIMPLNHRLQKDVIIQLNEYTSKDIKFLQLSSFIEAIPICLLSKRSATTNFRTSFVVTGCVYTSFFSRIGKTTFYRYFFQHAEFITSGRLPGMLADIGICNSTFEMGFISFL